MLRAICSEQYAQSRTFRGVYFTQYIRSRPRWLAVDSLSVNQLATLKFEFMSHRLNAERERNVVSKSTSCCIALGHVGTFLQRDLACGRVSLDWALEVG